MRLIRAPRVSLGSGDIALQGWIPTDIDELNILVDRDWRRYFAENSIAAIVAEHVWEHLTADQATRAARYCYRYLRPGGRLRVAVPDGLHPDPAYIDAVKPGGTGAGADDHKVLYTLESLVAVLEAVGFTTHALEHFDEQGTFHAIDWDPADGLIRRSARFDERNEDGRLRYTSIIVDAIKPAADGSAQFARTEPPDQA